MNRFELEHSTDSEWLSLKRASQQLGIHYTTLRAWADEGKIRVFRTPGGHRRFHKDDLNRFLAEHAYVSELSKPEGLVEAVMGRVRAEMEKPTSVVKNWHYSLDGEAVEVRRRRGRQLFRLAVLYVMKRTKNESILEEGRLLGIEYGREAALKGVGLVEIGRAVQFFRGQLLRSIRPEESQQDSDDMQIQELIDQFFDEVLYAVLAGYEEVIQQ